MRLKLNNNYVEARVKAYPSHAEQFDILFHEGYDAWKAVIQDVKDRFPKPDADPES